MLTIFTIPKPFAGHVGIIQRNALASWARLGSDTGGCQVIVLGDEAGVEQAARQVSAQWVGEVKRNEFGTPLLSDAFARVAAMSRHEWLCYVNADILLAPAFVDAFRQVKVQPCVAIGRRMNVDVTAPLDLTGDDWSERIDDLACGGAIGGIYAIDMLLFPRRDDLTALPPFAVGRPGWDNWFVWRARRLGLPLVDVSAVFRPIHQNHDYRHVPQASGHRWEGPEANANRALMDGRHHMMDFRDVTHTLTSKDRKSVV